MCVLNQILYVAAKSGDTAEARKRKLSKCGENAAKKQSEIIAENCVQFCRAQWAEGMVWGGGRGRKKTQLCFQMNGNPMSGGLSVK
jgi:hypothetical protein